MKNIYDYKKIILNNNNNKKNIYIYIIEIIFYFIHL